MTINVTKGEEFDTVFLMGFEDGIFPSYLSIFENKDQRHNRRAESHKHENKAEDVALFCGIQDV